MKVQVIEAIQTKKRILPIGLIMDVTEITLAKLAGKVRVLYPPAPPEAPQASPAQHPKSSPTPTVCTAKKVGGRICGAPLKTGVNGFLSCSDMACQVPAIRRGGKI